MPPVMSFLDFQPLQTTCHPLKEKHQPAATPLGHSSHLGYNTGNILSCRRSSLPTRKRPQNENMITGWSLCRNVALNFQGSSQKHFPQTTRGKNWWHVGFNSQFSYSKIEYITSKPPGTRVRIFVLEIAESQDSGNNMWAALVTSGSLFKW